MHSVQVVGSAEQPESERLLGGLTDMTENANVNHSRCDLTACGVTVAFS
jgi:hypothetical protein